MVVTVVMVYPDPQLRTKNKNTGLWAMPVTIVTVVTVYPDLTPPRETEGPVGERSEWLNASVIRRTIPGWVQPPANSADLRNEASPLSELAARASS